MEQPKRPPRRKSNENALQLQTHQHSHHQILPPSPEVEQKQCIKSILKRPTGMSSPLPSPSSPTVAPAPAQATLNPNDNDVKMDSSLQFINSVGGGLGSGGSCSSSSSKKSPALVRVQTTNDSGSQFYIPLPSPLSTSSPKGASPTAAAGSVPSSPSSPLPSSNLPIFQARKKVQFMVEDKIIQDKDKNDDYEDEDNENDVDDNKDNNGSSSSSSSSSFSVYDDVATTNYRSIEDDYNGRRTSNSSTSSSSVVAGDYDVMCNDNKNHKGNGNGSINNCCNLNSSKNNSVYNSDTDDITHPFKHGKPTANNNTINKKQQHCRQRATLKSNHGKFSFFDYLCNLSCISGCCNLLYCILVLW